MRNIETGERIPLVYRFDTETGDYWFYVPNEKGMAQLDPQNPNEILKGHGRCRLRFEPFADEVQPDAVVSGGK